MVAGQARIGMPLSWCARCQPIQKGTSAKRAGQCWLTLCVVSRRSEERTMPPCSAMERSRLMTRQTVMYGANHSSQ